MKRRFDLRREEGVAMTEFALIVPVFLVIVVGILAFGRVFFYWIETNHEASEAARWAVVDRNPYKTCADVTPTGAVGCQSLQQHARGGSTQEFASDVKVCIDFPDGTVALYEPVRVRIQKPFTFLPILGGMGSITIKGSSTMRVERFANGAMAPQTYSTGQNIGACT